MGYPAAALHIHIFLLKRISALLHLPAALLLLRGEDSANPVTYMTLESVGRLSLHDPTISLRINKNTSSELWELAIETSKLVGGLPLFQNDEVIIPGELMYYS